MDKTSELTVEMPSHEIERAFELDRKHVFHSWSAQDEISPIMVTKAEGSYFWTDDNRRLLDFSSQLVYTNVGHQHPVVVQAIQEQAARLCTIAPQHVNEARGEAAYLVADAAPANFNKVFFTNGGAEANEHAIRMARQHTGRHKVLSTYRSYHGGTDLAVNVTGDPRRIPNDYGTAGIVHFFGPFFYRSPFFSETEEEEGARALKHLRNVIEFEGATNIAAIILESIPGTAGVMLPPPGYLKGVKDLAMQYGIVFIVDEVMAGFGRTGSWFAFEHYDVVPDLITFAKGVNSGYVPLGGVIISDEIAATFSHRKYPGGLTYSGHPLATAAARACIEVMRDEKLIENASSLGRDVLQPELVKMAAKHASVGDVRGKGAMWVLELVQSRTTKKPLDPFGTPDSPLNAVMKACMDGGVIPLCVANRIHIVPPLNVPVKDLRHGLAVIDEALSLTDAIASE